jgi:hypothetical protein
MRAEKTEMPCCSAWANAQRSGTDNEGYGSLLNFYSGDQDPHMGCDLPTVEFCPWCGAKKPPEKP